MVCRDEFTGYIQSQGNSLLNNQDSLQYSVQVCYFKQKENMTLLSGAACRILVLALVKEVSWIPSTIMLWISTDHLLQIHLNIKMISITDTPTCKPVSILFLTHERKIVKRTLALKNQSVSNVCQENMILKLFLWMLCMQKLADHPEYLMWLLCSVSPEEGFLLIFQRSTLLCGSSSLTNEVESRVCFRMLLPQSNTQTLTVVPFRGCTLIRCCTDSFRVSMMVSWGGAFSSIISVKINRHSQSWAGLPESGFLSMILSPKSCHVTDITIYILCLINNVTYPQSQSHCICVATHNQHKVAEQGSR